LKQTIPPIVPNARAKGVAQEAIESRAASLNARRDNLYELAFYYVLLYEPPSLAAGHLRRWWLAPSFAWRARLSTRHTVRLLEAELERAIGEARQKAQAFEIQLSELGSIGYRRRCISVPEAARQPESQYGRCGPLVYDTHLTYFVADSAIECHRGHLVVGDRLVRVLSMKSRRSNVRPRPRRSACRARGIHGVPRMAASAERSNAPRIYEHGAVISSISGSRS